MSATSSSDADWLRHATALEDEPEAERLAVGSALHQGRFVVQRELGRGGMGVVYEAYDRERDEPVAIKTLLRLSANHLQHLKSEFRALADVAHPNLVMLHGLHCDAGRWFIAMQRVLGDTLAQRALAAHELGPVFAQIATGLHALHQSGRVHRDLKPSNVMLTRSGQVVIVDFGLVSRPELHEPPSFERFCGTPSYAAPEQRAGGRVQAPADWYAFGVMLRAQLIALHPALVKPDLAALCEALLEADPARRAGARDVLQVLGAPLAAEGSPAFGAVAVVGRQRELMQLTAHWQATRRGAARHVLLRGASGVGKTALVARFERALRSAHPDLWWIRGACYPRETIAYNACDAVVDELAGCLRALPVAEREALCPEDGAPLVRMFPVLADVLGAQAPRASDAPMRGLRGDATALRDRAFIALRRLLAKLAHARPVVIVIDDVHWGDAESAALLRAVFSGPDAPSLLCLLVARPALQAEAPCVAALHDLASELAIESLPLPDAQRAAAELLGRSPEDDVCKRVALESGGHPFLLRELCRYTAGHGQEPSALSLDALLRHRATSLALPERRLAQLVALSARPLTLPQCNFALSHSAPYQRLAAAPLLDALCGAQLLSRSLARGNDVIEPYHARIREALCAELDPAQRRALHAALAATFEASATLDAEAVIEHLLGAGLSEQAAQRSVEAAERAFESLSFDRAAALLQLALRVGLGSEALTRTTHVRLAEVHAYTGHALRAAEAYLTAAALAPEDRLALRCRAAHQFLIGGYLTRGLPLLREVTAELDIALPTDAARSERALIVQRLRLLWRRLSRAPREGPLPRSVNERLEALGLSAMGLSLFIPAQGATLGARYLAEALDRGNALHLTLALSAEAAFMGSLGTLFTTRAERAAARARQLADQAGDPVVYGFIETAAGMGAVARGDFRVAHERCLSALSFMQRFGTRFAWERSTAQAFLGLSRFYLGDLNALRRDLPALLQEAPRRGNLLLEAMLYGGAGTYLLLADDQHETAERELLRLRGVFPAGSQLLQNALLTLATAMLYAYRGDARAVQNLTTSELPALQRAGLLRMPLISLGLWFLSGASALRLSQQERERAAAWSAVARRALTELEKLPTLVAPAFAGALRALIAHINQRSADATSSLRQAEAQFERAGLRVYALAARRQAARWQGGQANIVQTTEEMLQELGVQRTSAWCNLHLPTFEEP